MEILSNTVVPEPEKKQYAPRFEVDPQITTMVNDNYVAFSDTGKYVKVVTTLPDEETAVEFVKHLRAASRKAGVTVRSKNHGTAVTWYSKAKESRTPAPKSEPGPVESLSVKRRKNASATA